MLPCAAQHIEWIAVYVGEERRPESTGTLQIQSVSANRKLSQLVHAAFLSWGLTALPMRCGKPQSRNHASSLLNPGQLGLGFLLVFPFPLRAGPGFLARPKSLSCDAACNSPRAFLLSFFSTVCQQGFADGLHYMTPRSRHSR